MRAMVVRDSFAFKRLSRIQYIINREVGVRCTNSKFKLLSDIQYAKAGIMQIYYKRSAEKNTELFLGGLYSFIG